MKYMGSMYYTCACNTCSGDHNFNVVHVSFAMCVISTCVNTTSTKNPRVHKYMKYIKMTKTVY